MTDDLTLSGQDRTRDRTLTASTNLVAVPDDPDDVAEVTLRPEDVSADRLATEWITIDVDDLLDVEELR